MARRVKFFHGLEVFDLVTATIDRAEWSSPRSDHLSPGKGEAGLHLTGCLGLKDDLDVVARRQSFAPVENRTSTLSSQ
jgi:hypothetical protein